MGYDGKILQAAIRRFEEDRARREQLFRQRKDTVYQREPRLRQIDGELGATMSQIIAKALRKGADPKAAVAALRDRNLALQREKSELLRDMGLPEDYLEEKPVCFLCNDSGYRGEGMCHCLKNYYAAEQKRDLSRMLDLGGQSFETFSLNWYGTRVLDAVGISPRENMDLTKNCCVDFAYDFHGKDSGNLLLTGAPGLGKTFLSACIARVVSERGYSVVYDTAGHVFEQFEQKKFNRDDEAAAAEVFRILNCDLLILDDLGTEMTTAMVQSALYELVNTRLMEKRSTIISTNLNLGEIGRRYHQQVASRIEGEYKILIFFGEDIRRLKREQ